MFSSLLSTHQLSLVFHPPIFYILATTTLSEELGIDKPILILNMGSLLNYALIGTSMFGMYTPTPL
jgi:hypothetical protein